MSRTVVLVSGAPDAGKTAQARPLARLLGFPLFGKDAIKETLHTTQPVDVARLAARIRADFFLNAATHRSPPPWGRAGGSHGGGPPRRGSPPR